MAYGRRFLTTLGANSRLIPTIINQNLRDGVSSFLRGTQREKQPKAGNDEEELRKRYTKETVEKILEARREEQDNDLDVPVFIELLKQNINIFHFFVNHCQGLYVFAGFGEPVRFDWLVIFQKAKYLKYKLKPTDIIKLEVIESELMTFERDRNVYLS